MSPTQEIESFRGESRKECSAFIQTVRAAAFKEGKMRDPGWMADYASIFFSDDALEWYTLLPQDVQEHWPKLQTALVQRWSSALSDDLDRSRPQNEPAAAPAPSPKGNEKVNRMDCGIIRAIAVGKNEPLYVQGITDYGILSGSSETALRLRFDSEPTSKLLECMNDPSYSWIAIHWSGSSPNFGRKSTDYAKLAKVDSETLKSSWGPNTPYQIAICRVSRSGEITFVWRNGSTETSLTAFTSSNYTGLYLAPDSDAYQKSCPTEKRVTLFLETAN